MVSKHDDYRKYYTEESIQLVAEYDSKILEKYDYSF